MGRIGADIARRCRLPTHSRCLRNRVGWTSVDNWRTSATTPSTPVTTSSTPATKSSTPVTTPSTPVSSAGGPRSHWFCERHAEWARLSRDRTCLRVRMVRLQHQLDQLLSQGRKCKNARRRVRKEISFANELMDCLSPDSVSDDAASAATATIVSTTSSSVTTTTTTTLT